HTKRIGVHARETPGFGIQQEVTEKTEDRVRLPSLRWLLFKSPVLLAAERSSSPTATKGHMKEKPQGITRRQMAVRCSALLGLCILNSESTLMLNRLPDALVLLRCDETRTQQIVNLTDALGKRTPERCTASV